MKKCWLWIRFNDMIQHQVCYPSELYTVNQKFKKFNFKRNQVMKNKKWKIKNGKEGHLVPSVNRGVHPITPISYSKDAKPGNWGSSVLCPPLGFSIGNHRQKFKTDLSAYQLQS